MASLVIRESQRSILLFYKTPTTSKLLGVLTKQINYKTISTNMLGKISEEVEVKASICEAWEVYSSPKVGTIIRSELAHLFSVDVLEGDGGIGTVVKVTPCPGVSMLTPYKERFTNIDHEKKMREVEIIEGGYLDLGITSCRVKLELIEKSNVESCIARLTLEYENEEAANAYGGPVNINLHMKTIEVINRYIENNKS